MSNYIVRLHDITRTGEVVREGFITVHVNGKEYRKMVSNAVRRLKSRCKERKFPIFKEYNRHRKRYQDLAEIKLIEWSEHKGLYTFVYRVQTVRVTEGADHLTFR